MNSPKRTLTRFVHSSCEWCQICQTILLTCFDTHSTKTLRYYHCIDQSIEWPYCQKLSLSGTIAAPIHVLAYTGELAENVECPECGEPRYMANGKPRRQFCYLPLIPRLQRFFQNENCVNDLYYRHNYEYKPYEISDVFDCMHYKDLQQSFVTVDGDSLDHRYFSDKRDIAFTTCLDSYLLYKRKRGGPAATPIMIQLYNLPPVENNVFSFLFISYCRNVLLSLSSGMFRTCSHVHLLNIYYTHVVSLGVHSFLS